MDLESLSQIKVADSSSTLIGIDKRYVPAMVTTITQQDIKDSGARSLDELLEIYVPDLAYMYKVDGNQLGIGGIISDRNNKILLTLNGKVLNIKGTDGGAVTERWYSMLGDIEEIEVISGPGSVIYGPGAIAGVINIKTFNADSFKGFASTAKMGYGEGFGSVDLKYGTRLFDGLGLFAYLGIDKYRGIDKDRLVNKFAFDRPEKDIHAYRNYPHPMINLNSGFEDEKRTKAYLEVTGEDFSFWSRFAKGSLAIPTYQHFYMFAQPDAMRHTGTENDQWSNSFTYRQKFDALRLEYSAGYIRSELEKRNLYYAQPSVVKQAIKQNEEVLNLKLLSIYEADDGDSYALGVEHNNNHFHKYQNDFLPVFQQPQSWHTKLFSLYGEVYRTDGSLETLADVRLDRHTYADKMLSYRLAEAYAIDKDKTLKANFSHSVRHMDEIDIYNQIQQTGAKPDTESIDRLETIYSYDTKVWSNYLRGTYNRHHIIGYNKALKQTTLIGTATFYTLEGKIGYSGEKYHISLSHTYTSLIDFDANFPVVSQQNISAAAYGYGNDFANWHNHITKVRFSYQYDESLKFLGSLRLFWGIPGAVDMSNYNRETFSPIDPITNTISSEYYALPDYNGDKKAFGYSAYLNLALSYKIDRQTTLSLHGYNLLGLFDEDINKRNYFQTTSNYFDEAPAVSVSLHYRFH